MKGYADPTSRGKVVRRKPCSQLSSPHVCRSAAAVIAAVTVQSRAGRAHAARDAGTAQSTRGSGMARFEEAALSRRAVARWRVQRWTPCIPAFAALCSL
mmetsp:Transcript_33749/g.87706  ORF Transcript_33749/g.87706 Transcript_33749/m.87706 type:complete len:99 (-) Transcript_33749:119-415(-)